MWYYTCRYILVYLSDEVFTQISSWLTYRRFGVNYTLMNIRHPRTFNEKINHLKLFRQPENGTLLADKYAVRRWVSEKLEKKYLIPLYGKFDNAYNIDFDALPSQFVLKTNHGSGWNIICTDKSNLNIMSTIKKLNQWLSWNSFYLSREYQYKNIKPCVLCEQLLGFNIADYKIFCFKGIPKFIQVDINRFTKHERAYFDTNWQILPFSICYQIAETLPLRPLKLEEMLNISRVLSNSLEFARIDLYEHNNQVYFGEITLCPEGGKGPFFPKEYDLELGKLIEIN